MEKLKKTIYLDYAAATPLDARVRRAMMPFLGSIFGNPSSLHHKGVEARNAVEASRKIIASLINAQTEEILFTSGGTESCNLAILGIAQGRGRGHIITTQIEHHAVLEPIRQLERLGWLITYLRVDKEGFVSADDVKKALRKNTVLVSVMYANNEIGTIEPVAEIGRMLRAQNVKRKAQNIPEIIFHTDACQAARALDINVNRLQVDLMSVSASKIYGPKGAGFLYIRGGTSIFPIIHGGGQERGTRSGTENVAGIVGLAKAMELAVKRQNAENNRLVGLRDYCVSKIHKAFPNSIFRKPILNGPPMAISPKFDGRQILGISSKIKETNRLQIHRLPNNINITIPGVEGEALMLYLDAKGICVSTGSACATGTVDASHVLLAIGKTQKQAKESIRITFGKTTTKKEIDYLVDCLKKIYPLINNS